MGYRAGRQQGVSRGDRQIERPPLSSREIALAPSAVATQHQLSAREKHELTALYYLSSQVLKVSSVLQSVRVSISALFSPSLDDVDTVRDDNNNPSNP